MRVYAVATTGGEVEVRAYKSAAAALAAAQGAGSIALERVPPGARSPSSTGAPTGFAVPGEPATVWLVVCGDGGVVSGLSGACVDQAAAEALAEHLEVKGVEASCAQAACTAAAGAMAGSAAAAAAGLAASDWMTAHAHSDRLLFWVCEATVTA